MKPLQRSVAVALMVLSVCSIAAVANTAHAQEVKTVSSVDLTRYAGTWYEIAKIPNRFQKKCVSDTTAQYSARDDGDINVTNRCKTADGTDVAEGVARVVPGSHNSKLQVRFAPAWLGWLPMVWGDYWIMELDDQYTLVTVGSPSREYLWILSRTPSITEEQYENAVNSATRQGFDTARLVKSKQ